MEFDYVFIHTKTGRKFRNKVQIADRLAYNPEHMRSMFLALLSQWNRKGMGEWVYYTESDITFVPQHTFPKGESHETIQRRLPL